MQEILMAPQVKVSKHLAYLREHGLISCERKANWSFYRLVDSPNRLLIENLKCLQDLALEEPLFAADLVRLKRFDQASHCAR